jgi:hypothetical protein
VDVYLVPIGRGRHALYCEPVEEEGVVQAASGRTFWRRWLDRFSEVLAAVEREHDAPHASAPRPDGFWPRLRSRVMRWMAEKVAEQRLLWRLRGRTQVRAFHPEGMDDARALSIVRGALTADFNRHKWWMVVDLVGGTLSLALTPIPGPNLVGYYFTFRIVGHFLALRGARHGLREVRWNLEPSGPLARLAAADALDSEPRTDLVRAIAAELGLPRLPRFCERAAGWSA